MKFIIFLAILLLSSTSMSKIDPTEAAQPLKSKNKETEISAYNQGPWFMFLNICSKYEIPISECKKAFLSFQEQRKKEKKVNLADAAINAICAKYQLSPHDCNALLVNKLNSRLSKINAPKENEDKKAELTTPESTDEKSGQNAEEGT